MSIENENEEEKKSAQYRNDVVEMERVPQCACIAAVNVVLGVFFVCLTTKLSRNRQKKKQSHRKRDSHNKKGIISKII